MATATQKPFKMPPLNEQVTGKDVTHATKMLGSLVTENQTAWRVGQQGVGPGGEPLYRGFDNRPVGQVKYDAHKAELERAELLRQQMGGDSVPGGFGPMGSLEQNPARQGNAARTPNENPTVPATREIIDHHDPYHDPYAQEAAEDPLGRNRGVIRASQQQADTVAQLSPPSTSEMLQPQVAPYTETQQPADWQGNRYAAGVPRHSSQSPY